MKLPATYRAGCAGGNLFVVQALACSSGRRTRVYRASRLQRGRGGASSLCSMQCPGARAPERRARGITYQPNGLGWSVGTRYALKGHDSESSGDVCSGHAAGILIGMSPPFRIPRERCDGPRCTLPVRPTPPEQGEDAGWKPALPAASHSGSPFPTPRKARAGHSRSSPRTSRSRHPSNPSASEDRQPPRRNAPDGETWALVVPRIQEKTWKPEDALSSGFSRSDVRPPLSRLTTPNILSLNTFTQVRPQPSTVP